MCNLEIVKDCNGVKKEILVWEYKDFDLKIKKVKHNIFEIWYDNHNFITSYKNRSQAEKFCECYIKIEREKRYWEREESRYR